MIERCTDSRHPSFNTYGGRGVTVDPRWTGELGFENFLTDMGLRPENMSLDRIDPNGNYEPSNCRWLDAKSQVANRRVIVRISLDRLRKFEELARKMGVNI